MYDFFHDVFHQHRVDFFNEKGLQFIDYVYHKKEFVVTDIESEPVNVDLYCVVLDGYTTSDVVHSIELGSGISRDMLSLVVIRVTNSCMR